MSWTKKFQLTIPSQLEELTHIEKLANQVADYCQLDEDKANNLAIAVTEVVGNAIIHGNKKDINKKVNILFYISKSEINIKISDEGKGFRPDCIPDPLDPKNLMKESGRGIFILRQIMDNVRFECESQNTTVHLTMNR